MKTRILLLVCVVIAFSILMPGTNSYWEEVLTIDGTIKINKPEQEEVTEMIQADQLDTDKNVDGIGDSDVKVMETPEAILMDNPADYETSMDREAPVDPRASIDLKAPLDTEVITDPEDPDDPETPVYPKASVDPEGSIQDEVGAKIINDDDGAGDEDALRESR